MSVKFQNGSVLLSAKEVTKLLDALRGDAVLQAVGKSALKEYWGRFKVLTPKKTVAGLIGSVKDIDLLTETLVLDGDSTAIDPALRSEIVTALGQCECW